MEALTVEMQAKIRKRSSERLRMYLIKAGRDEDDVMTWDRDKLMEEWALEIGKEEEEFEASPASPVETDYELQKRRLEFEIRKYEREREKEEREERRREEEKKEQKEKEEREERRREEEKKEQKEERERERKEQKEKEEREERRREQEKKEQKEKEERERKEQKEKEDVRAKLLLANLSERAKALTMRLTKEQLNDYQFLKEFLLREFKISPSNLRARFWTMCKASDESFTIYSSKLRVALMYYLKSRKITDEFDKLVSLLVADRLKESLSKACLDYILAQEKEEWLSCEDVANAADIYVASHDGGSD